MRENNNVVKPDIFHKAPELTSQGDSIYLFLLWRFWMVFLHVHARESCFPTIPLVLGDFLPNFTPLC